MPVYVTRAHVTIGDANRKPHRNSDHRRSFHISDICRTPYCFRSFLVVFLGLAVVAGGVCMTIIGYKPAILIPWYHSGNSTENEQKNVTDPTAVPRFLGEPGPLRILVYIGPILMGIGFFSMMMAIVLFCEIKDRYFNNVLPKRRRDSHKKENLYAMIIDEFRKNYFRGIEVPLQKPTERRKTKQRFSLSLSRSGSIISFGRRLSHEFQRKRRRSSRESQPDRVMPSHRKKSSIRKFLDPDSWLKTSSLPNIRHKDSLVELQNIYNIDNKVGFKSICEARSCGPQLNIFRISGDRSGVDNPAYRESPPDKRKRPVLKKQKRIDTSDSNTHVTTVLVHRESNNEETTDSQSVYNKGNHSENKSHCLNNLQTGDSRKDAVIDIDKDITIFEKSNEIAIDIPDQNNFVNCDHIREDNVCTCVEETFCTVHALGMDSGSSSLSLSWDNIPCVYNDARRNTEPFLLYAASQHSKDTNATSIAPAIQTSVSKVAHREVLKSKSTAFSRDSDTSEDSPRLGNHKKSKGPFKTKIGVFKSDSNLFRSRRYSFFDGQMYQGLSSESLDLTDDMLKNFEMAETAYI